MGQVIAGRFELLEPIADGGQGTVWHARDLRSGADCAAKVLKQSDSAALLRFVREQGVQVDHPHLASPYGWAAEDSDVAIAMPLVSGGSLEGSLADHGAFSEPLAALVLLQLLDGLAALHEDGWVHRDVKPGNLLLEPTGVGEPHVRLGDMGLAMRVDDPRLTRLGHVFGTPGYVAAEAAEGDHPAPEQDLFSAGRTVLRLLGPERRMDAPGDVAAALEQVGSAVLRRLLGEDGLTSADPARRSAAAAEAPRALAPLVAAGRQPGGGFLTAAGEPFEVFDLVREDGEGVEGGEGGQGPEGAGVPTRGASSMSTSTAESTRRLGIALLLVGGLALLAAFLLLVL